MLPKAARPFGAKISVIIKNGETQG